MKTITLNGAKLELTKEQEKDLLAQLTKKQGRFKPERGDKYYCISSSHGIDDWDWGGFVTDLSRYSIGNVYRTKEEAEQALKTGWVARLQAEQRIKDYILEKGYDIDVDWGDSSQVKYSICYSFERKQLEVVDEFIYRHSTLPHFSDSYEAEDTLNHCIEDYKLLLGVE